MATELAFALINPYTLAKSRTGGVLARLMSRTGLNLVAARMFAPSKELVEKYAKLAAEDGFYSKHVGPLMSEYIRTQYAPDATTGRPKRVMMLLFEGSAAVSKVRKVTGNPLSALKGGDTIRGTFGDYLVDDGTGTTYFEPAVLVGPDVEKTGRVLRLFARHAESDGGFVDGADDVPRGKGVESTLVMLKPDNFQFPSLRAGHIVDVLSRSGLRIIAMKKFSMTVAQAEKFYGPVLPTLRAKVGPRIGAEACELITENLGFELPEKVAQRVINLIAPAAGDHQFERIVKFMTGYAPADCTESEKSQLGKESCIALVYRGVNAVKVIRDILGPTDPSKAPTGSVRREFGSNIMVNAAHASDSTRNASREIGILSVAEDTIRPWVKRYY